MQHWARAALEQRRICFGHPVEAWCAPHRRQCPTIHNNAQAATAALEREAGVALAETSADKMLAESIAAAAAARSPAPANFAQAEAAPAPQPPSLYEAEAAALQQGAAPPQVATPAEWEGVGAVAGPPAPAAPRAAATQVARRWRSAVGRVLAEAKAAEARSPAGDGSLVFSAASLSLDVDPQELLLAALERARERLATRAAAEQQVRAAEAAAGSQ